MFKLTQRSWCDSLDLRYGPLLPLSCECGKQSSTEYAFSSPCDDLTSTTIHLQDNTGGLSGHGVKVEPSLQ